MQLTIEPLTLELREPFRIAHGTSQRRENLLVRLDAGLGEAAAVDYLGETRASISEYLRHLDLSRVGDPLHLAQIMDALPAGSSAARAAIDIALHDAWGQQLGVPLYRLFELDPERIPVTSFTIAIGTPAEMARRAHETEMPVLKIKLGTDGDEARLMAIRQVTEGRLRADANGGWSLERAERMLPLLVEHGVELIEQPLPAGDLEGLRRLSKLASRPPIFVDESIRQASDIQAHAGLVEGIVVKLAKSGGLRAAREQINVARALGLEVMLGCMIESSIGVTAAAHLAPLCQYIDLDAPLLIANDPFQGVRYERGHLILPSGPGLGLEPR